MDLILVRHGQTDRNVSEKAYGNIDLELNDVGKQQVHNLGSTLKKGGVKAEILFTSPSTRAVQTAQILNIYLNVPMQEEPLLREISFGKLEGVSREVMVEAEFGYNQEKMLAAGAETVASLEARIRSFLIALSKQRYQCVVCVSHGLALSVFIQILLNEDLTFANIHAHQNADFSRLHVVFNEGIPSVTAYKLLCLQGPAF